jgi:hypothetical protein
MESSIIERYSRVIEISGEGVCSRRSASVFNENSFEKTKEDVKRLGILKVIGKSILGKLKPGAKVPFEIHKSGNKYEIGDIIVFTTSD